MFFSILKPYWGAGVKLTLSIQDDYGPSLLSKGNTEVCSQSHSLRLPGVMVLYSSSHAMLGWKSQVRLHVVWETQEQLMQCAPHQSTL